MLKSFSFFMLAGCVLMAGCSREKKVQVTQTGVKNPVLTAPFKFHKLIEVSPGQDYDILSWGRGSADTGAFLILHSDSSGKKYTTTTGDLFGTVTDVYNTDMDVDGNPEILIQTRKKDTVNNTAIYAFEFKDNKAQKLDFPKLTSSQKKGYRGNDNFYIEEGKFIREFPIYNGSGKEAKPTGEKRKLQYGLRNNSFTVEQLSKDSIIKAGIKSKADIKPAAKETVKKVAPAKKQSHSKKHHQTEKHKKHHRRHHHNDEE